MDRMISVRDAEGRMKPDRVAVEEPLQITVDGHPVSVVMRTPGHDDELVRGFLQTEGIVAHRGWIRRIELDVAPNHAHVFLTENHEVDLSSLRRNLFSASSCGICGRASIESVTQRHRALDQPFRFASEAFLGAPDRLRVAQRTFESTGGLHAAGLFDERGELLHAREDVGRHNAVDKVIGRAMREEGDFSRCFLLVSGRVSFEIMQKALAAGIPAVAAISAPSSLAVEFAEESGQTLVAFLRPPGFNLYAGEVS